MTNVSTTSSPLLNVSVPPERSRTAPILRLSFVTYRLPPAITTVPVADFGQYPTNMFEYTVIVPPYSARLPDTPVESPTYALVAVTAPLEIVIPPKPGG